MTGRKPDIIWLSLDRADNKYSSTSISMAKELSKSTRVFFINNPVTHFEVIGKRIRQKGQSYTSNFSLVDSDLSNFFVETPPTTLSINWLQKGTIHSSLLKFNNLLLFNFIQKVIKKHNIEEYIFVNVFNPFFSEVQRLGKSPLVSVYYSVDEIAHSPYLKKHGPWLEASIASNYDLIFTTSTALEQKFQRQTAKSFCLPNAADTALFSIKSDHTPKELEKIDKPIVIYTGHTDWRMDLDLMIEVIQKSSELQFLFVGPVSLPEERLSQLESFQNVLFVGTKHLKELPAYLYSSACAIIPYKRNELTRSIYPLKINEYLATGIPVVATPFSPDITQFADIISLADTAEDFRNHILASIRENTDEKGKMRRQRAAQNTWPERAKQFWELIKTEGKTN